MLNSNAMQTLRLLFIDRFINQMMNEFARTHYLASIKAPSPFNFRPNNNGGNKQNKKKSMLSFNPISPLDGLSHKLVANYLPRERCGWKWGDESEGGVQGRPFNLLFSGSIASQT